MMKSNISLAAVAACCLVAFGCVKVVSSRVVVQVPLNRQVDPAVSVDLREALEQELSDATLPAFTIQSTVCSADDQDALRSAEGTAYARELSLSVRIRCTDAQGHELFEDEMTGTVRCFAPRDLSEMPIVFAEARRKMCYDVAHQVRKKIGAYL